MPRIEQRTLARLKRLLKHGPRLSKVQRAELLKRLLEQHRCDMGQSGKGTPG